MSGHIRKRIAKLIEELEETEEVVFVFAPWAVGPQAPSTPPASTPPEPPSAAPPEDMP